MRYLRNGWIDNGGTVACRTPICSFDNVGRHTGARLGRGRGGSNRWSIILTGMIVMEFKLLNLHGDEVHNENKTGTQAGVMQQMRALSKQMHGRVVF